jgi:hypothetical protein
VSHISFLLSLLALYSKSQSETAVGATALSAYLVAASMADSTVTLDSTKTGNVVLVCEFEILSRQVKFVARLKVSLTV